MNQKKEIKELHKDLQFETDTSYLYKKLAELETNKELAEIYAQLSQTELKHAYSFLKFMQEKGIPIDQLPAPSFQAKIKVKLAKKFGTQFILPTLLDAEKSISNAILLKKKAKGLPVSGFENTHPRILQSIMENSKGGMGGKQIAGMETQHQTMGGNALRAAVLGANDGLVSNLSLVMGVAGASSSNENILIAGFAGLLAGAISMALGEWLSVQSSRELFERQIRIEEEELENNPEEEAAELAMIYRAKGVPEQEAKALVKNLLSNKTTALDTLAREELGVDPEELGGSAWVAAFTSFFLFAAGAIIPLMPFLFLDGMSAVLLSLGLSAIGLFGIGAAITLLTSRSIWFSGMRQVFFGLAAAAVTYGIGYLVGVSLT